MMKKIGKTCQGFDITSHDTSQSLIKHIIGLKNNKRQYTNGWINNLEQTIYENIQTVVSSQEQILNTSGEGLELRKCAWYLITREYIDNGILCIDKQEINKTMEIKSSNYNIRRTIQYI